MRPPRLSEWADYFADRVSDARRRAMDRAAEGSASVSADRARALAISDALSDIGSQDSPELPWDHIGARIHWDVSLARRTSPPRSGTRRRMLAAAAACASIASIVAAAVVWHGSTGEDFAKSVPVTRPEREVVAVATVEPEPLRGAITLAQGDVTRDGHDLAPRDLNVAIEAGTTLSSREGRIAVQLDDQSAFEIGPQSTVTVARFDAAAIELHASGLIDVDITHRPPGQRFVIVAAGARVEVRGTRFRVNTGPSGTSVACTRGLVEVDFTKGGHFEVAAGRLLSPAESGLGRLEAMSPEELAELDASLAIPMLEDWIRWPVGEPHPSGAIVVSDPAAALVAVNGTEVGLAPVFLRVAPGRYHVANKQDGAWGGGGWFDVGVSETRVARRGAGATTPRRGKALSHRRAQLTRSISNSPVVTGCLRRLRKLGLADGAFLDIDIAVDEDGTQRHLNVVGGDLPPAERRCVRAAIDRLELGPGSAARLRHRVRF